MTKIERQLCEVSRTKHAMCQHINKKCVAKKNVGIFFLILSSISSIIMNRFKLYKESINASPAGFSLQQIHPNEVVRIPKTKKKINNLLLQFYYNNYS